MHVLNDLSPALYYGRVLGAYREPLKRSLWDPLVSRGPPLGDTFAFNTATGTSCQDGRHKKPFMQNVAFLHAKLWIPGGYKSIFTVVIPWLISSLRQFARARTIEEFDGPHSRYLTFTRRHRSTVVTSQC